VLVKGLFLTLEPPFQAQNSGSKEFISETKRNVASSAIGRNIHERDRMFELREPSVSYSVHFDPKKHVLRPENTSLWNINAVLSAC